MNFTFWTSKSQVFTFFRRVRRFCSKTASQNHDLVSNDPILDSKVVPDELGQLGRPAERAGRAWPARAGQPGRPVLPAGARLAPTWRAGGLLPGKGTREERRRGRSAQELMEPPHSYRRRWVVLYTRVRSLQCQPCLTSDASHGWH